LLDGHQAPDAYGTGAWGAYKRSAGENIRHLFGDEFLIQHTYGAEAAIVGGLIVSALAAPILAPAELTIVGIIALGAALGAVDYAATTAIATTVDQFDGQAGFRGPTFEGFASYTIGGAVAGPLFHGGGILAGAGFRQLSHIPALRAASIHTQRALYHAGERFANSRVGQALNRPLFAPKGRQAAAESLYGDVLGAFRRAGFDDLDNIGSIRFVDEDLGDAFARFAVGRGYGPEITVGREFFRESLEMQRLHLAHEIAHSLQSRKMLHALGDNVGRLQAERVTGRFLNFTDSTFDLRWNPLYSLREVQAETLAQRVIGSQYGLSRPARARSNAYIASNQQDFLDILAGLWD
jgi:hypothetical protein